MMKYVHSVGTGQPLSYLDRQILIIHVPDKKSPLSSEEYFGSSHPQAHPSRGSVWNGAGDKNILQLEGLFLEQGKMKQVLKEELSINPTLRLEQLVGVPAIEFSKDQIQALLGETDIVMFGREAPLYFGASLVWNAMRTDSSEKQHLIFTEIFVRFLNLMHGIKINDVGTVLRRETTAIPGLMLLAYKQSSTPDIYHVQLTKNDKSNGNKAAPALSWVKNSEIEKAYHDLNTGSQRTFLKERPLPDLVRRTRFETTQEDLTRGVMLPEIFDEKIRALNRLIIEILISKAKYVQRAQKRRLIWGVDRLKENLGLWKERKGELKEGKIPLGGGNALLIQVSSTDPNRSILIQKGS